MSYGKLLHFRVISSDLHLNDLGVRSSGKMWSLSSKSPAVNNTTLIGPNVLQSLSFFEKSRLSRWIHDTLRVENPHSKTHHNIVLRSWPANIQCPQQVITRISLVVGPVAVFLPNKIRLNLKPPQELEPRKKTIVGWWYCMMMILNSLCFWNFLYLINDSHILYEYHRVPGLGGFPTILGILGSSGMTRIQPPNLYHELRQARNITGVSRQLLTIHLAWQWFEKHGHHKQQNKATNGDIDMIFKHVRVQNTMSLSTLGWMVPSINGLRGLDLDAKPATHISMQVHDANICYRLNTTEVGKCWNNSTFYFQCAYTQTHHKPNNQLDLTWGHKSHSFQ